MSNLTHTLDFVQLDVFAERALEGNALALFPDAASLAPAEMQAIARETNLSETTFLIPRAPEVEQQRGVQLRIFTTQEELPFAGHPTLGSAAWVFQNHPVLRGSPSITLELPVGPIVVHFDPLLPGQPGPFGTMRQNDPTFGQIHSPIAVASALGLSPDDLDPDLPIQTVSTGLPFCIVPLRSLAVAARLRIPAAAAQEYLSTTDAKFFFCIAKTDHWSDFQPNRPHWHARMQFYNGEDPATGSASGCAISYLVRYGLVPSGQLVVLEQGVEMLRPSRIYLQATLLHSRVSDVYVGGRTIPVAMGRLFIPRFT